MLRYCLGLLALVATSLPSLLLQKQLLLYQVTTALATASWASVGSFSVDLDENRITVPRAAYASLRDSFLVES